LDLGLSIWSDSVSLQPIWDPTKIDADAVLLQRIDYSSTDKTFDESMPAWNKPDIDLANQGFWTRSTDMDSVNSGAKKYPLGAIVTKVPGSTLYRSTEAEIFRMVQKNSNKSSPAFVALDDEQLTNLFCKTAILKEPQSSNEYPIGHGLYSQSFLAPRDTISSVSWVRDTIEFIEPGSSSLTLYGPSGFGKTHNAILLSAISSYDTHRPVLYLDCKKLCKSKPQMMALLGEIDSFFRKAISSRDVIVVLDDIDQLAPNTFGEGAGRSSSKMESTNPAAVDQSKLLADRLSHWLEALVEVRHNSATSLRANVIFTCTTVESIHPSVFQSNSFAPNPLHLPLISPQHRMKILASMIRRQCPGTPTDEKGVDLSEFETLTDGFYARDLEKISLRVGHIIESTDNDDPLDTSKIHGYVATCLSDFVPLAQLTAGKPSRTTGADWSDIGGLFKVKQALETTILYPVIFRKIYERSSVRLPRGVLLYGESGCGKSYVVPALAKHCNFPLVTCRGPEVLDKYIGASEAKVRQLFERAAQMAPSILFLDELDALAPRRGSDSTGVTDRVVNQLLTYLDGAEDASSGTVYIIGATSRPDKIDPALIRPGRLEQHLYVGPPETESEWRDLLIKMSKKWKLTSSCCDYLRTSEDIMEAVESIPRLSPADIRAVFDTAQLNAVHSALKTASSADDVDTVCISIDDVKVGFRETRPSLQESEATSLQSIYRQFQGVEHGSKARDKLPTNTLKTSLR
jgi:SpoVK/Ycf46/Vps4 family AAA+-type ATPase